MTENILSQKSLKNYLHYNSDTGIFIRKIATSSNAAVGDIAGYLHREGYIIIRVDGKGYLAHRLAWLYMAGKWPEDQIDHINHIRNDNRWRNLREATQQENCKNRSIRKTNTSGVTGVCWHKARGKWDAYIKVDCRSIFLGSYVDRFEAICARLSANNKHGFHENHGRNATNNIGKVMYE